MRSKRMGTRLCAVNLERIVHDLETLVTQV